MQNNRTNIKMDSSIEETSKNKSAEEYANKRNLAFPLIVIGASAGGLEAIKTIVAALPKNLGASLFIVWHMSPDVRGILPQILNKLETLAAAHAYDGEPIVKNRIYVAPPDHHLLVQDGILRVTRGPKENRFRPAVDPLFRSAAYTCGSNVIGVILSGALDDGTAGLWTVKHYGGIAIVQDPADALVASMPENAMREVKVDYCVPVAQMPDLLQSLIKAAATSATEIVMNKDEKENIEIRIAADEYAVEAGVLKLGEPTIFTCPECHGVLSAIKEGNFKRYRCHTGHAFSPDSLLSALTDNIENGLWNAVRSIEESTLLLNHIGDHFADVNQPKLAALYFQKALEATKRAEQVRQVVHLHEQLSEDNIEQQAK